MMNKNNEQSVAIKLCFKADKSATKTFKMLKVAYGGSVMSRVTIFRGYNLFAEGREKTNCVFKNQKLRQYWSFFFFFDSKGIVHKQFIFRNISVNALFYHKY